jgi:RNA polymerase sigma factor (sigma-70 family)
MNEPLDELLARLSSGNADAATAAFVAFEPFLRKAIRRHLPAPFRSKFDSADIVQSVWADVIRGFREAGWRFVDADHLRGFLFVATRNRLIDRMRQHHKGVKREESLHGDVDAGRMQSPEPRPSEIVQAEELWQRIQARCPPEHLAILSLKRQGHSLSEIAERTGLHSDSIRRILRTIARRIAFPMQESAPI